MEYTKEQIDFIKSIDFMKLGQAINHEQWQSAAMIIRRMGLKAEQVGINCFDVQFVGIRQNINRKDKTQAKQVLSLVINKRVQLMKQIQQARQ